MGRSHRTRKPGGKYSGSAQAASRQEIEPRPPGEGDSREAVSRKIEAQRRASAALHFADEFLTASEDDRKAAEAARASGGVWPKFDQGRQYGVILRAHRAGLCVLSLV